MNLPPAAHEVAGVAPHIPAFGPGGMRPEPRARIRGMLRTVLLAWRGITRRQVRVTFVVGVVLCVGLFAFLGVPLDFPGRVALTAVASQLRAFAVLLVFVVADRVAAGDPRQRGPYIWAVLVGAVVAESLAFALGTAAGWIWVEFSAAWEPSIWAYAYALGDTILITGATVWVILDRRRAASARKHMLDAELDRIAAERRSLESDLQAMQARVEPQFLFNTLSQVRDLYREVAPRGERMLDELIAYLRAAMPRMRDTASTLDQELELTRAFLAIVAVRLGDRLTVSIDAPAEGGDARMPPMLLLPLVDHAIGAAPASGTHSIAINGAVASGVVRLTVAGGADAFATGRDDASITDLRERLAALFGQQGSLTFSAREDGTSQAVLEMPLEEAPVAAS